MESGGMVAVVQGLQDSGLTVTLLDGLKQYTLMPESAPCPKSPRLPSNPSHNSALKHQQCAANGCAGPSNFERCHRENTNGCTGSSNFERSHRENTNVCTGSSNFERCHRENTNGCTGSSNFERCHRENINGCTGSSNFDRYHRENTNGCTGSSNFERSHRENGVQATDGRYASTYKMMHCHVNPTSPPQNVTEFPPQRPEVIPGHSNFVVGGYGSGESFRAEKSKSFKGAMCWPDRGSVCISKPSTQPDAFANSLRKYPAISPERSTEIVERLISFTQAKNLSRNSNRCPSPTRNSLSSESSRQTYLVERNLAKSSEAPKRNYQPDFIIAKKKTEPRTNDNSPIRERSRNVTEDEEHEAYDRPLYCKSNEVRCFRDVGRRIREEFRSQTTQSNNSVNMEIQAAVQMESKEILTLPRIVPMQRSVATLSSIVSNAEIIMETRSCTKLCQKRSSKSIQVKISLVEVKTASSSAEICKSDLFSNSRYDDKSKDQLGSSRKSIKGEILKLLQIFNSDFEYVPDVKYEIEPKFKKRRHYQDGTPFMEYGKLKLRKSFSESMCLHNDSCANDHDESKNVDDALNNCINIQGCDDDYFIERDKEPKQTNKPFHKDIKINDIFPKKLIRKRKHMKTNACCSGHMSCKKDLLPKNKRKHKNIKETVGINQIELRNLIDLDILAFTEKYRLNITTESLHDLREELVNIFIIDVNDISIYDRNYIRKSVKNTLQDKGFTKNHAAYLTNTLIEHWEEEFSIDTNLNVKPPNTKSDTFIILPNITQNGSKYQQCNNNNNELYSNNNDISQNDIDYVNVYLDRISNEINDWISNSYLPQIKDNELRQAMINDLANDIVDRKKYLELNPLNEFSEASELEYLKYQIFKWVYKLVDDNNMPPVDNANELMKRIQSVPVPIFSMQRRKLSARKRSNQDLILEPSNKTISNIEPTNYGASSTMRLSSPTPLCCKKVTCKRNNNKESPKANAVSKEFGSEVTTSTRRMSSPGNFNSYFKKDVSHPTQAVKKSDLNVTDTNTPFKQDHKSLGQLSGTIQIKDNENEDTKYHLSVQQDSMHKCNEDVLDKYKFDDDYIQYVKDWVMSIPIPVHNVEDEITASAARTEIYNYFLEFVYKIKSELDTFNNRFLLEDILDDEIEKLLVNLPQSPELTSRKHFLKVKLIEKTINTLDFCKTTYKQHLVESVKSILPEFYQNQSQNSDILELYEDLQILNIVEDFIICSGYQNVNKVLSEGYRIKLLERTKAFIEELKANHNTALKNLDAKLYIDNILETLKAVPKPNIENIQEEADEVLLGLEVDDWFSQLPLISNKNDFVEQLNQRRLRNNLMKQIFDIEKGIGNTNYSIDTNLKSKISKFLENVPLQAGQSVNINSMVDKLITQLKNRALLVGKVSKKVDFHEPDYNEFSKNMPLCSTHIGYPEDLGDNDMDNQNKISFNNKSIQAILPSEQTFSGRHNISKPPLDDLRLLQDCCENHEFSQHLPQNITVDDGQYMSSSHKHDSEPQWYTLQECTQDHPQIRNLVPNQNSWSIHDRIHAHSLEHNSNETNQYRKPSEAHEDDFVVPEQYLIEASINNNNANSVYQRPNISQPSRRSSPKRGSINESTLPPKKQYQDSIRNINDRSMHQRFTDTHMPVESSSRRRDSMKNNQRNMRQTPINSTSLKITDSYENSPQRSSGWQNITEERRNPQSNQDLFYRSTDQEGIRRTIERNRSMEANWSRSAPPKNFSEYNTPLVPPGYVPLKMGKKAYVSDRNMDGKYREDSEDDDDDEGEGELRCRCMEKMWRSTRRLRYCPFDEHNGYPMCMSTPYFYPFFY